MKRVRDSVLLTLVAVTLVFSSAGLAAAQKRNDRDIRDAVRSLDSKIEDYEANLRYQMQSTSSANTQLSRATDDIRVLRDSIRDFQDNYDRRRDNRDDVNKIVDSAKRIDDFLQTNPQNRRVMDDWGGVRKQIDRLASNYGVLPNWNLDEEPQNVKDYPEPIQKGTLSVGLSGTYQLDAARSESIDDIVTDTKLGGEQREDLKDKLTAPEQIAIDIRGNQVTLATTNASPITFTADGRDKTEQSATGKTIRLRATLNGQMLTVSSLGGETDYTITFTSISGGKGMKISRRITTDYLDQTVFAESVYNKTDSVAQLGITPGGGGNTSAPNGGGYSDNDQNGTVANGSGTSTSQGNAPSTVTNRPGNYIVPNGVTVTGILENEINTKYSQNNDRFRLTVQTPDEYRGAVVEGYITGINRSGKVTGRSKVTFNFEKITLRDGQTYDFAGNLQNITDMSGKVVNVDNEGTAQGDNQTKQTAKRGGIGAGIGAVIGAIAGGAKGAAIGAIIGAGGGAGTVAIQGASDIQLQKGSTLTIQSSSPLGAGRRDR